MQWNTSDVYVYLLQQSATWQETVASDRPAWPRNPRTDFTGMCNYVAGMTWPHIQICVALPQRRWSQQTRNILYFILSTSDWFGLCVRHMTCFRVRRCLVGVVLILPPTDGSAPQTDLERRPYLTLPSRSSRWAAAKQATQHWGCFEGWPNVHPRWKRSEKRQWGWMMIPTGFLKP